MLTPALVCPELIGRREELAALMECRRAAAAGHGALVLVGGDAGIGKTRLLRAFRESLTGGRAAVGSGAYDEFANLPYAAIVEALHDIGSRKPLTSERTRAEQLAALADRLAASCTRRNVVLILEDLQWADEASFAFLLLLMRSLAALRLLVVATYRSDELNPSHVATPYIARLARDPRTHRIMLDPLAEPEMQRLVRSALDGRPPVPRREMDDIIELSGGNPFFAQELLKNALEHLDGRDDRGLPLTIRAAVAERLTLLDTQARDLISLAAVVGRRFDARFVAEIAEVPLNEVFAVLRGARDLQLIDELPTHPVSYEFHHALTRDAIYADMLLSEVRPLHQRILAALENGGTDRHGAADLGYHAWAARDADKAARYNERAGDEAELVHAYADAARSYERALEFASDDAQRGRLLEKSARSNAHDGNATRAARLAQAAIEAYRRSGRDERVAEMYYLVAGELHAVGESERAMELLRDGLDRQRPDAPAADRARLALPLAYMLLDRGAVNEAEALVERSSAAADDAGFGHMYWNTRLHMSGLRADPAAAQAARDGYLRAVAGCDAERRLRAHLNIGSELSLLGQDEPADAEFVAAAELLRQCRLSAFEVCTGGFSALHHARAGRFAAARTVVEQLLRMAEPWVVARVSLAVAALTVGRVLCDDDLSVRAGDPGLLEAAFRTQSGAMIGRMAAPYARRLHDRGEDAEAIAILRRALAGLASPYGATETLLAAVELGDAKLRRDAVAVIEPMDGTIPLYAATIAHMRAVVARREGDERSARDFAGVARAHYEQLGWRYHATICTELAGDNDTAAQSYRSMGAIFDTRRIELGAVSRRTHRDGSSLSPREWEIAELIAGGTPNRAVAERLTLSEKTVEKHLTAIYQKLGFRNRSQLAAFVIRSEPSAGMPVKGLRQ